MGHFARIYLCEKKFFLSPRVIPTFNRCSRRCGTFFTEEGGVRNHGGVIDGGEPSPHSHKISFWKRKTASQKHFFIRRKGEKSRGGGEEGSFSTVKKTRLTLYRADQRAEYWGGLKFYSCGGGWPSVGSNPALRWKSRTSTRTSSIEKGNDARRPKKKNFFHKDKCGHNKPLYFFWASHSSTKNSCFLVKEWAWTQALKNIV